MLICFNLRICRSERVFTEMMMPRREGEGLGFTTACLQHGGGESRCMRTRVPVDSKGQRVGSPSSLSLRGSYSFNLPIYSPSNLFPCRS